MLKKVRRRWGRKREREVQNVHVNSVHLHMYEIMLTQATTHTHTYSSYMTLIGMHEINGRVAPFCQQYLFSQPQLALYDQWECMCLINASLSSTGWYCHSEDRLTVHIYYVECLAQGTYIAHVHLRERATQHTQ